MEFKEYNGKNVDEAVTKACVDLGVPTEKLEYEVIEKQQLLCFVPKSVVKKYITNEKFKEKVLSMWDDRVHPLRYKKDNGFLRKLLLLKIAWNYIKEYKENNWDWN